VAALPKVRKKNEEKRKEKKGGVFSPYAKYITNESFKQ
jgi:hypothetical protein